MTYSVTLSQGKVGTEQYALFTPRFIQPNRRAVIYAHGAAGTGGQALDVAVQPSVARFMAALAHAGFVVLSADFGGVHTYGNDTELASMESWWAYLQGSGLCATDKVILTGASMGTLSTHRFAKEHPSWVAGMNVWVPFVDVEYGRTVNILGLRDNINSGWGTPAGSYLGGTDQSPLPARATPLSYAAALGPIPTHMWYSTGDTVSTNMDAYLTARGGAAVGHVVSSSLPHGDAAIGAADINAVIAFLNSVADGVNVAGVSRLLAENGDRLQGEDSNLLASEIAA